MAESLQEYATIREWADAVQNGAYGYVTYGPDGEAHKVDRQVDQEHAQSQGQRLIDYYTALKEHMREPEQLALPETDRRQEVLAFASQWHAEHGAVQSSATEQRYAAIQDAVATRQSTREQTPSLEHAQSRDLGMELS